MNHIKSKMSNIFYKRKYSIIFALKPCDLHAGCRCSMTNTCALSGLICNCDRKDYVLRYDGGRATERHRLPITEVRIGDTGNSYEKKSYTVGPLICYSQV